MRVAGLTISRYGIGWVGWRLAAAGDVVAVLMGWCLSVRLQGNAADVAVSATSASGVK